MGADRETRAGVPRCEKVLTVLLLFGLTKPFYVRADGGSSFGILESGPSGNLFLASVYGVTLLLLWRQGRAGWRLARAEPLLASVVVLAIASALWSLEPYVTFRAGILLIGSSLAGLYLAVRYSRREQVELAAMALTLAAVLSLLAGLAAPSYAITDIDWRGVFQHKNNLGRLMTLGAITCALAATRAGPWRRWAIGGAVLSFVMAGLSGSSTAIVVILAAVILTPLYILLGAHIHLAIAVGSAALLVAGAAVALFLGNPGEAFQMLGRDATLTGRTALWEAVTEFIAMRPWLGYGYQAFWFGEEGSADVKDVAGWVGASAHNGFLDVALAIGIVGLALFTLGFLISTRRAGANLRRARGLEGIWPLAFLAYFFLYNLTETSLLLPTDILWAMYVGTYLSLSPAAARAAGRVARAAARYDEREFAHDAALEPVADHGQARVPRAWAPRR